MNILWFIPYIYLIFGYMYALMNDKIIYLMIFEIAEIKKGLTPLKAWIFNWDIY